MKLMEYQGKDLFRRAGIPTPRGVFARTPAEVRAFVEANPGSWVIKSQVMMGGRGKAGGGCGDTSGTCYGDTRGASSSAAR